LRHAWVEPHRQLGPMPEIGPIRLRHLYVGGSRDQSDANGGLSSETSASSVLRDESPAVTVTNVLLYYRRLALISGYLIRLCFNDSSIVYQICIVKQLIIARNSYLVRPHGRDVEGHGDL
jgi:hypothetical protein